MTILLEDVRLGAQRPRWAKLPPLPVTSAGAEAIEQAAAVGLDLYDWQKWWLNHALAERDDGDWCARENVLITGRQSGKNVVLAALELAALFVLKEPLIIHSAHEVPTAMNHFHYMLNLIDESPDLSRKCLKPVNTNGREAIRTRHGSMLQFRARGRNSGRGLTAGRLIFDEAFQIAPESMGALIPTMRAMSNTQITYAASAPKADSMVLHSLIRRGRADDPDDRLFYAEWGNPPGTEMDDVDAWYQANPSLGLRIEESTLHDEFRTLVAGGDAQLIAEFAREAVGIGELPSIDAKLVKLPVDKWKSTGIRRKIKIEPGEITIAFDVDKDGQWSTIGVGAGSLKDPYVEVIEHRQGVGWLPARLVELVQTWKPRTVGCNGAGPAGGQVGPVLAAFSAARIDANLLDQMDANRYKQACGGFYTDVIEGRLKRPAEGQGPLDIAAGDAAERPLGDAWAWDRRNATVPISPLVVATIARALLPTEGTRRSAIYGWPEEVR